MMRRGIIALVCMIAVIAATAHRTTSYRGAVVKGYNFWLYEPDSAKQSAPKPVVIFLHGASLCGKDMNRVRRYGTLDAVERGREVDAYIIAPQNPGGSWQPEKIMNILEWVEQNHNIDTTRVYVMGMSLGGYGTIDMVATYPDKIAAAMAFCGGATVKDLSGLNKVPLWIVHGTADRAVSVGQSDQVVSAMQALEPETPRLIYDRVPGMNHSQPARFFYMQECYDWLFSHSLNDPDRMPAEKFDLTGGMSAAYKDLKHNPKKSTKKATKRKSKKKAIKGKSKKKSSKSKKKSKKR